jgi:hypothetical protein
MFLTVPSVFSEELDIIGMQKSCQTKDNSAIAQFSNKSYTVKTALNGEYQGVNRYTKGDDFY